MKIPNYNSPVRASAETRGFLESPPKETPTKALALFQALRESGPFNPTLFYRAQAMLDTMREQINRVNSVDGASFNDRRVWVKNFFKAFDLPIPKGAGERETKMEKIFQEFEQILREYEDRSSEDSGSREASTEGSRSREGSLAEWGGREGSLAGRGSREGSMAGRGSREGSRAGRGSGASQRGLEAPLEEEGLVDRSSQSEELLTAEASVEELLGSLRTFHGQGGSFSRYLVNLLKKLAKDEGTLEPHEFSAQHLFPKFKEIKEAQDPVSLQALRPILSNVYRALAAENRALEDQEKLSFVKKNSMRKALGIARVLDELFSDFS